MYAACSSGFYGDRCEWHCSEHCNGTCDHVNGTCACKAGYTGEQCDKGRKS